MVDLFGGAMTRDGLAAVVGQVAQKRTIDRETSMLMAFLSLAIRIFEPGL